MRRTGLILVGALVATGIIAPAPAHAGKVKLKPIAREAYTGGSHLDFGNGYAYGGELNGETGRDEAGFENKGGIHVFDITGKPGEVGFFKCPGNDLDVAYVKPGLVAVGFHKAACVGPGEGIFTLDVSNPRKPKKVGEIVYESQMSRTHAIARYPGKPLIYAAGGGLGARQETVTMVDVSKPSKPKIAGTFLAPPRGVMTSRSISTREASSGSAQAWARFRSGTSPILWHRPLSLESTSHSISSLTTHSRVRTGSCSP